MSIPLPAALRSITAATLAALALLPAHAIAQDIAAFDRREITIPMRDGVLLHAVVLAPAGATALLPILLVRTPFGTAREVPTARLPPAYEELAKDGYIFVFQDIRGRGGSGGTFVTLRPLADRREPRAIDESTDAYDTVEWLVAHLPRNSGQVGVLGHSYRGWLAAMAAIRPHPALKAVSPQAPVADVWLGDDFFHQGAFRPTQAVLYSGYIEGDGVALPEGDPYQVYRRYPTLDSLAAAAGVAALPASNGVREHPSYDEYWRARALQRALTHATVPTLIVGGWWDEEDILGAQLLYRTLERTDSARQNRLVLGPWSHGAWVRSTGDSLGPIALGSRTSVYYRTRIERPWFAYYLHGTGDGRFPEAWLYETGADRWRTADAWPGPSPAPKRLYLHADGRLAFAPPTGPAACDAYVSDPATPVPNAPPDGGAANWLLEDQRFLAGRSDVRTWRSEPLAADLTIAGDVAARIFASTAGTDADWVVKLIDVFPDSAAGNGHLAGYQLMVSADILRGRYWRGFDRPAPLVANRVHAFTVDMHQQLYRFRKGHRLMVQVQSTWFPMYDRNPQRYVPNIFGARGGDYQAARHCIWRSARYPSHLTFGTLP